MSRSQLEHVYRSAVGLLEKATTANGILASLEGTDNYQRVWARDSVMAGIGGGMAGSAVVMQGLKKTLLTLKRCQDKSGKIPSNVRFSKADKRAASAFVPSYGGTVGRVDSNTWFVIGVCYYIKHQKDKAFAKDMYPPVERVLTLLDAWEFNTRGLVYVPLGGNWADEYIVQGYTLYDQLLRLWALRSAGNLWKKKAWLQKADEIKSLVQENYWIDGKKSKNEKYNKNAYYKTSPLPYFACSFMPSGYNTHFDLVANSLAILLDVSTPKQSKSIVEYCYQLAKKNNCHLLPNFYPIIYPNDKEWDLLENNYAYQFKNKPGYFHNGGIWQIMNGWFALALNKLNETKYLKNLEHDWIAVLEKNNALETFPEFFTYEDKQAGGVKHLCYSAIGIIQLHHSLQQKISNIL